MLKRAGQIGLAVVIAGFLLGVGRFAYLRFSSGELYPEYSSLRADPLGTKALYESLERVGGYGVERRVQSRGRFETSEPRTVFILGAFGMYSNGEEIERWAREGARVVIALNGNFSLFAPLEEEGDKDEEEEEEEEKASRKLHADGESVFSGIEVKVLEETRFLGVEGLVANRVKTGEEELPEELEWRGIFYFQLSTNRDVDGEWDAVYEVNEKSVVLERKVGLGRIVLCADSFLFSNEALFRARSPEFLVWAAGKSREVMFNETHLGVEKGSSIMVTLREYGLEGLFLGLIATAALWVWKSAASFVPPYPESGETLGEGIEGKTTREGVIHLLQRNIAPEDLPGVCLAEWKRSHPNVNQFDARRLREAEDILEAYHAAPRKERKPVETYRLIARALSSKASP